MSSLEQKSDTLFEIINNVVKELTLLKQSIQQNQQKENLNSHYSIQHIPISPFYNDLGGGIDIHLNSTERDDDSEAVVVFDEEESDIDTEDDSDSESESESDDGEQDDIKESENKEQDVSGINSKEKEKEELLKIIKLELNKEDGGEPSEESKSENVIIHKIDETNILEETKLDDVVSSQQNDKEYYNKLTTQQLKTIVVSKGISTEVSKLRRHQLMGLLENATSE